MPERFRFARWVGVAALSVAASAAAQAPPASIATSIPLRSIGATIRTSTVTFTQVQHFRRLSDGHVLVNDPGRHQVLLLDSTLANPVVVIDSSGGHDDSYGIRAGGLVPFRGDSTLFADPTSSTLLVIDPAGHIARVMSMRAQSVVYLTSPSSYGYPGYSPGLGLVYRISGPGMHWPTTMPPEGAPEVVVRGEDSSIVVAMNVTTRKIDTLARLSVGYASVMRVSYNNVRQDDVGELFPQPDDWALMADGSIALLSGREYRVRWINADGTHTESPRLPYTWRHNDDDEKQRVADSINAARDRSYQERLERFTKTQAAAESLAKVEKRPAPTRPRTPTAEPHIDLTEIPDYFPAYDKSPGSLRADADTNLWIRPRQPRQVPGGPIYDIVNRKGQLIDRVQLPAGRTLVGFGPGGIVYLAVRDAGQTRIEAVHRQGTGASGGP